MIRAGRFFIVAIGALALAACAKAPLATATAPERAAIEASLMRDISVLASDEFAGRKPGTPGEARTVEFLIEEMGKAGLTSGTNDPGSEWLAPVELVNMRALESRVILRTAKGEFELDQESAAAFAGSRRAIIDGVDVMFVGREAEDVRAEEIAGKIVVMLGEPGVSPRRRALLFEANPAAIITIVQNDLAIANVRRAFGRERLILASEATNRLTGFVTTGAMEMAMPDGAWAQHLEAAQNDDFTPQMLEATIAIDARTSKREFVSSNVIGKLPGTMPDTGAVLLLGHWDHLGECGREGSEDRICNGAIDNASGIAMMLELSRRLAAAGPHDRDIYVLATTAEESGLFGARVFAETPPVPLDTFVAAFNFDSVAIAPAGSAVGFIGEGRTVLDEVILQVLDEGERQLGDREYAEQFVRRQDGWALLDKGVPAVFLSTSFSSEIVLGPFLAQDYHQPSDEVDRIQLGGAVDDLLLHEELIMRIANTATYKPPAKHSVDSETQALAQ